MLNLNDARQKIETFIKNQVECAKVSGVVCGVSGGVDSAVAVSLAVEALGADKVLGLIMPDSRVTPDYDTKDAVDLCKKLKIQYKVIDIAPIHSAYMTFLDPGKTELPAGNLRARIRMGLLYYHSNLEKRLVLGTEDKSESYLGYFTKYGDSATDFEPIADLYKTDVRLMAKILGISDSIIKKESSPRLWRNQTAVGELGLQYEQVDKVIRAMEDTGPVVDMYEIAKKARVKPEVVKLVVGMNTYTDFKRKPIPHCSVR